MTATQMTLFTVPPPIKPPTGILYWGTDGKDLKHGYTTHLVRRGGQLKLNMLWSGPGTMDDERANHRRWIRHRIPDTLEWYYPDPELLEHLYGIVPPNTVAWMHLRRLIFRRRDAA